MKIIDALKLAFVLLCLTTLSFTSNAQVIRRDVVYLKNGSVIKGAVLEMVPGGDIKIKTADGSIFVYKMDEVEKTEKEEIVNSYSQSTIDKTTVESNQKSEFKHKGYFIIGRLGPAIKGLEDDQTGIDITGGIINGYQINDYISLGLGLETMSYTFGDQTNYTVRAFPVFLDTRIYIPRKGGVQPMFFGQFGYAFTGNTSVNGNNYYSSYSSYFKPTSGGAFLALGAGIRVTASNRISLLADGGFSLQTLTGTSDYYDYQSQSTSPTTNTTNTATSMRFNIGVMINLSK